MDVLNVVHESQNDDTSNIGEIIDNIEESLNLNDEGEEMIFENPNNNDSRININIEFVDRGSPQ